MNPDEQNGELFAENPAAAPKPEFSPQPAMQDSSGAVPEPESRSFPGRSCGTFLRRERERQGLSLQEVYEAVKIKPERIEALEKEDFDALPEPIYIIAYIRRLCEFYHVKGSVEKELIEGIDLHKTVEVPEDFSKTLKGFCVDEENAARERRIIFTVIILALVILILIGTGIALAVIRLNAPEKTLPMDEKSVEEILLKQQTVPKLRLTEL